MSRACRIILIVLAVLGLVLVAVGTALIFVFRNVIRQTIEQEVALKNGSESFKAWKSPPAIVYMQFWMYNVTNPWEIIERGDKPNVTEHGPYTYREIRTKEDIEFIQNETQITYRESKAYVFDRNMSVGSQNDSFTMVNLPIVTISSRLQGRVPGFILRILAALLSKEQERLFEEHTVYEFLWGYEEKTLVKLNNVAKKFHLSFNTTVGLFIGGTKNGSDDGQYDIYSGVGDIQRLNVIQSWKGKRSIYVDYNTSNTVHGIPTHHFVPPPSVFMDHTENPDNIGFCVPKCLKSGVLDVTKCKKAPIIVSQPHFYQGAKEYIEAIEGMHPSDQYSTFMDVEPYTGKALRLAKKLQLNAKITVLDMFKDTSKFTNLTILPFLWLNESATLSKDEASKFWTEVMRPMTILEGVQYGLIVLGAVILLCVLIYVIQMVVRQSKDDDVPLLDGDNKPRGDI